MDLSAAQPLTLDSEHPAQVTVDGTSPCWQPQGGAKGIYLAFALPQSDEPYLVFVGSNPLGNGLFSARLVLLAADGSLTREVPRDDFRFHGLSLVAGIRVHAGERYLVVASDPASVGHETSRISGGTQLSGAMVGTAFVMINTGYEATSHLVFAYNGIVRLAAKSLPKID